VSAPEPLQLVEVSRLEDSRRALVVQTRGGERYILWPGEAPTAARPPHPGIARRAGQGSGLWAERLPGSGCRLSALVPPLDPMEAAELFALIADALSALHASAQAHGDLSADAVALSPDGEPVLLGAGRRFAEPHDDLAALATMWDTWCDAGSLLDLRSAASLAEGLRMWLAVSEEPPPPSLPGQIRSRRPAPRTDTAPLQLPWRSPAETVDEIGINIGPDESERGLLDPLTWSGLTGEPTSELPGTGDVIEEDTRIDTPLAAVLARLLQLAHQTTDRFTNQQGVPSAAVQALLEQEPLDILPAPEAYLPSGRGDSGWEDNTATAIHSSGPPTATAFTPPLDPQTATVAASAPAPRGEISFSVLAAAVTLALLAGAAGVWLLLASLS
jgi:hypothetical protein